MLMLNLKEALARLPMANCVLAWFCVEEGDIIC